MTAPVKIPNKVFFRIGEVSRLIDLPEHTIRYWEEEFRQIRPEKTKSGQRLYRRRDIELLTQIKQLLWEKKFKIAGARLHLRGRSGSAEETAPVSAPGTAIEAAARKTLETREKQLSTDLIEVKHLARLIRDEVNSLLERTDRDSRRGVAQPG